MSSLATLYSIVTLLRILLGHLQTLVQVRSPEGQGRYLHYTYDKTEAQKSFFKTKFSSHTADTENNPTSNLTVTPGPLAFTRQPRCSV